jgi:hypothetical protein
MGYNVYISEKRVLSTAGSVPTVAADIRPFNADTYPGDTDPATDYETFEAGELNDGVLYYAAVTIVYPDGAESAPSNMVEFVCHPSGDFSLKLRYSGDRDGYSFGKMDYVASDDIENHIYYGRIDGDDYLLSPSRLDDVLQSVRFYPLEIETVSDPFDCPPGPGADKIKIEKGKSCLLKTEAGQYAKIIVKGFSGSGGDREVNLKYSFMPTSGYTDF